MYTVVASNSLGNVVSSAAFLTVNNNNTPTAPTFTTQPQDQHVTAPATATFTAAASGNPAPTYQWYVGITATPNATSGSYTTPATSIGMSGNSYTVVATNSVGSVTSNAAYLSVNPPVTGMDGIYCGTITLSGTATPMIAAVTASGEFRFAMTNDWVGNATLSGSTGSGTLYTAKGATPNTLSLTNVVVAPGASITGTYAYGSASGTFSLNSATNPNTGVVLYDNPTMTLPVTGYTSTTVDNAGWQSSAYPWTAVNVDALGNITMTVNKATVTGTLTQITGGLNLYRIDLSFTTSGNFTGLGWWSGDSYSGPAGGYGWPLTLGTSPLGDGFFADVFYCILSTVPGNPTYNLGVAAAVTYPQ
jgi:Immunoglobulin domain